MTSVFLALLRITVKKFVVQIKTILFYDREMMLKKIFVCFVFLLFVLKWLCLLMEVLVMKFFSGVGQSDASLNFKKLNMKKISVKNML
jgi:hypothetical protein